MCAHVVIFQVHHFTPNASEDLTVDYMQIEALELRKHSDYSLSLSL